MITNSTTDTVRQPTYMISRMRFLYRAPTYPARLMSSRNTDSRSTTMEVQVCMPTTSKDSPSRDVCTRAYTASTQLVKVTNM